LLKNVGPVVANLFAIGVYAGGEVLSAVQAEGHSNIEYYWFDSHLGGSFSDAQIVRNSNDIHVAGLTPKVDTDTTVGSDFGQWSYQSPDHLV
jgi:hypothetical protein